ncbi:MAG: protein kinase [Chloroflexi bacterium]|nr:protein kinase [Chloroflexota bacterium]
MQAPKWINSRYELIGNLGSGGSSTVHKAIDRKDKNERIVAVKLLGRLPDRDRELQKEFFAREVRALSMLSHPTIVLLLDHGHDEENQILYLVLEYIERAESLRVRLPRWEPEPLQCCDYLCELLSGISYAHQSHIIHRDLNPGNILMDSRGNAKIIDFGISKILGTLTVGQTVGDFFTRPYASPEQVNQQEISYSVDIYSLAAVLYFMLTRRDPDPGSPLSAQFQALSEVPSEIRLVAQRMADEVPTDRFQTAHQAMLALRWAWRNLESKSQKFYLLLTSNAIRNLYDQTVTGSQSPVEARKVVQEALASGVHIVCEDPNTPQEQYDLIGDSLSLRCSLDRMRGTKELSHLVVRSIQARIPPHALERMRQNGFLVSAQWQVGTHRDPFPADSTQLTGLLDEIDEFMRRKAVQQGRLERRLDLVETWRNILYLDRDLKKDSLRQVEYVSWDTLERNMVIKAQLAREVNLDELYAPGQLLAMPSTRLKVMTVGRYLRQEGNCILISKLPGVKLDLVSAAGKISVDERQWAAAWHRQRLALDTVVDERCVNPRLPNVLLDPKQAEQATEEPISRYFNQDLDESKKKAVSSALSARDVYLIQGPPGTGKTVLISEIVAQVLWRNPKARILLVSQSNVAVDNVLTQVGSLLPDVRMVRVGREERIAHGAKEYLVDRRLAEWAQRIREKSNEYLAEHHAESDERRDLEADLEIIQEIRPKVKRQASEQKAEDGDLMVGIELLQERFLELDIEPTARSLERLAKEIREQIDAKKSALERTLEEWLRRVGKLDDFEDAYLRACSIVAGTCVGIAGKRSLPERFDWVIVDEAGRATPSEILIPLVRAQRSILVGDHKQLPPVIEYEVQKQASEHADIDPIWLERSLFEHLFRLLEPELSSVLRVQYRMHPHIAQLISNVFYQEEELETGVAPEERLHGWEDWATAVVWYSTSQLDGRFEATNEHRSKYNLCEASIVENQLSRLEKHLRKRNLKERKTVAIVSGYSAQMEHLERQLDAQDEKRWKALSIEINTVDAFQGRERDIVFYSVVRSNPKRQIGFLSDCRRLNVALSRARELLFIVGDHRMVAQAHTRDGLNPFRDVIAHIVGHPTECTLVEG